MVIQSRSEKAAQSTRLFERIREVMRLHHYSKRTEEAYLQWIKRFVYFHKKRHPRKMGAEEITAYLTHLAVNRKVSASTQNQALNAILFLYRSEFGIYLWCLLGKKLKPSCVSLKARAG